jgi:transcription initiation factor TFIIH subunit 4
MKSNSDLVRKTLTELHHLGLVTMKKVSDPDSKFCVNHLLKSFLHGQQTRVQESAQFIVVESNFKVYAYTESRLYQAILRLFMREDYRFPNLVVGMLTRDSLNEAFRKKITA